MDRKRFENSEWRLACRSLVVCLQSLIPSLQRSRLWLGWLWELAHHFRWHYAVLAAGLSLLLAQRKRPFAALIALILGGLNLRHLFPYVGNGRSHSPATTYRAVMLNVYWRNHNYDPVLAFLRQTRPHFFVIVEATLGWQQALATLADDYPFQSDLVLGEHHGTMLFSRLPLAAEMVRLANGERPSIVAQLLLGERPLTVFGVHPPAPVQPHRRTMRDEQMARLAPAARCQPHPVMVLGDLNMTPWTATFATFLRESGLKDGRLRFGLNATWPAKLWIGRIPIDHALVSPHIAIHRFTAGPNVGSDHLPIIVDFSLQEEA